MKKWKNETDELKELLSDVSVTDLNKPEYRYREGQIIERSKKVERLDIKTTRYLFSCPGCNAYCSTEMKFTPFSYACKCGLLLRITRKGFFVREYLATVFDTWRKLTMEKT